MLLRIILRFAGEFGICSRERTEPPNYNSIKYEHFAGDEGIMGFPFRVGGRNPFNENPLLQFMGVVVVGPPGREIESPCK